MRPHATRDSNAIFRLHVFAAAGNSENARGLSLMFYLSDDIESIAVRLDEPDE